MKKLVLYSAVSLDNCIARKDGGVEWLDAPRFRMPGEDFGYKKFLAGIDTTIMGYKTYKQALTLDSAFPYQKTANYVLTRSSKRRKNGNVVFVNPDIPEFVRGLKRRKGKDIWLVGGGEVNTFMVNQRLIDRMILTIVPVVLGEGIRLFAENVRPTAFVLKKRKAFPNGFVQITWDKK